jgi:rhamnosyltransferase
MITEANVCAVIVAFHPDNEFKSRLADLLHQVNALVVVDNTPAEARQHSIALPPAVGKQVLLIENHDNLGVGAALNQGLNQTLEWGCDWLLTLDQDSRCYPDMVQTLLNVKATCVPPSVVIGGNYLDTRNGKTKVPVGADGEFLDQKTVITSGCLVDARFAQAIGGFREDYFIDQLDHEFCLRARANGGKVVISRKPVMAHSVGEVGGAWLPKLGYLPNHSPMRKYYVARNSLTTIAIYWRREPDWCMRRLVRLVLGLLLMATLERQRLLKVRAFVTGIADGLHGRMGLNRHKSFETVIRS